jgi:acyl-coenzyme A thioesterase PaaI-like protein
VHGDDSIIRQLHAGENPALRGARMWVQREAHKIHACWPLGANVCGHTGIGHGGVTGLLIDETFGTLYTTLLEPEMGPGFTVNLNVRRVLRTARRRAGARVDAHAVFP